MLEYCARPVRTRAGFSVSASRETARGATMDHRRSTITLPNHETASVKEAKDLTKTIDDADHSLTAWALAIIEQRDTWFNTKRRGART